MKKRENKIDLSLLRQVFLILLLMASVFVASTGGVQDPNWAKLLEGISISVIAAVLCLFFLAGIDRKNKIDAKELGELIREQNSPHIVWVERNMDVPEQAWIDLIEELDSSIEPAWFLGTKLSWWIKTGTYREPLKKKLLGRYEKIISTKYQDDSSYATYILLSDRNSISSWRNFINNIVEEAIDEVEKNEKSVMRELCFNKTKVVLVPKELVKYSAVLSGSKLFVTNYISNGGSDDCPTLEVRINSVIWNLYANDIKHLLENRVDISK